jgi:hypothetical protein
MNLVFIDVESIVSNKEKRLKRKPLRIDRSNNVHFAFSANLLQYMCTYSTHIHID